MALHTLGLSSTTALQCSAAWLAAPPIAGSAFTPVDLAAVDQSIVSDGVFGSILQGFSYGVTAVLTTATTAGTTSLTVVTGVSGPPIGQIQVGDVVLGVGIPLGTFVTAVASGGATITLSQAATSSASGVRIAFVRLSNTDGLTQQAGLTPQGTLHIPNRGILKVLPGDRIAVDNSGWPILVSGNSIGYAGSQWTFT